MAINSDQYWEILEALKKAVSLVLKKTVSVSASVISSGSKILLAGRHHGQEKRGKRVSSRYGVNSIQTEPWIVSLPPMWSGRQEQEWSISLGVLQVLEIRVNFVHSTSLVKHQMGVEFLSPPVIHSSLGPGKIFTGLFSHLSGEDWGYDHHSPGTASGKHRLNFVTHLFQLIHTGRRGGILQ